MKCVDFNGIGDPVIVFTFGRSGTHMIIDLIRRQFPDFCSWKYPFELNSAVFTSLDSLVRPGMSLGEMRRLRRAARPILMTHSWSEMRDRLEAAHPALAHWIAERSRVVHVVRDPKAAITSAWPIHNEHARRSGVVMASAQAYVGASAARWAADLEAMKHTPHLQLRYEDIRSHPAGAVKRLSEWIGSTPRWRTPIMARPHPSTAHARVARIFSIRPDSCAAVTARAVIRRYTLAWTPSLEAALRAHAGPELARLSYVDAVAQQSNVHLAPMPVCFAKA
jgi:hypothetical protein